MTTGKEAMRYLQQARPPHLDNVDSRVGGETIVAQPRGRTRGTARMLKWGLAGAVPVVAAAVALALASAQPAVTTPPPGQNHAKARTAHQLLAAAATNALEAETTGRYFVTKTETGYVFSARGYEVLGRRYTEHWHPLSSQDRPFGMSQHLGAAPFGPGSEAAWRADGSPTEWTIPGDGKNPDATKVTAAAGPRTTRGGVAIVHTDNGPTAVTAGFLLAGQILSAETMAALPTNAAGLRAWLIERYHAEPDPLMNDRDRLIYDALQLIAQIPVTTQVRSAAYQMLAELDTATLVTAATDQRGRTGSAVTFPVKYEDGVTSLRVIFNENSGDLLSIEQLTAGGKLRGYTLMVSYGWTDETPAG